jgi:hypothetical protein
MKQQIVDLLFQILNKQLEQAKKALESTKALASSDDMKSESKYDTRGIEAGYLAGAQEKRVKQLQIELNHLKNLNIELKDDVVPGALIKTSEKYYFITFNSGGHKVKVEGIEVNIISIKAPLVEKILNDQIEIISIN